MALNFSKKIAVGVAINPNVGLEVAQIDFASRTVLKYGSRPLDYDYIRNEIADMDIFKEALQDLLFELQIPKGAEVSVTIPAITQRITEYPASMDPAQMAYAVEDELAEYYAFKEVEAVAATAKLPNSTIQFNRIVYTAASKNMIIELAVQIKELGYKLVNVDTSINATLNSLIYNGRVDVPRDTNWVLLIVENNYCRIIPMQGNCYTDSFEERISIGDVLGDDENYSTIVNAIDPLLKNMPAERLYVVSKTDIIRAQTLAEKLSFNGQVIHEDANCYSDSSFINLDSGINKEVGKSITLDVIGAAINKEFRQYSCAPLNLFNESLGDIYIQEQPPVIKLGSTVIVASLENMISLAIKIFLVVAIPVAGAWYYFGGETKKHIEEERNLKVEIARIDETLKQHENVSVDLFDEGDEVRIGLLQNKNVFSYYSMIGTETPKKLWLTSLSLDDHVVIKGQADNLESVYSFFRNLKDYNPNFPLKIQKLGLATHSQMKALSSNGEFDSDSILTSLEADFYEFVISDVDVKDTPKSSLPSGLEPIN
ncbi:MAG: hypothetical protein E7Z89_06025 [Cyanobacteria bacterium SIG28]|nr:hypothetical protein [Cyanobacteria bacterium SIG28]